MDLSLHTGSPQADPTIPAFLDAAFERPEQESRLVRELASNSPAFDPSLALLAKRDGRAVGWALYLPRRVRLRGSWVPLAISSPFVTAPDERRSGVAKFLLEAGFAALLERGMRGALVIGGAPFFQRFGYAPAFNLYGLSARREDLPSERVPGWRGLQGDDLEQLQELFERSYREVDGCERRELAAHEWEAAIPHSHSLVWIHEGRREAYLRFRVRHAIELRECGVAGPRGVHAVLCFLGQLLDEHGRAQMEAHLPPCHPVARSLFHAGALEQASNFDGEALLCVLDWRGLVADTAPGLESAVRAGGGQPLSVELGGEVLRLEPEGLAARVGDERVAGRHLWTPPEWGPALFTGQRNWHDLALDQRVARNSDLAEEAWDTVRQVFGPRTPMWTYAPIFEVADS